LASEEGQALLFSCAEVDEIVDLGVTATMLPPRARVVAEVA
jgi:hypothetical protein